MRKLSLPLLVLVLGIAACTRHSYSSGYSSSDGSVVIDQKGKDSSSMKITGRDGKQVSIDMNTGSMPADYPKDVPVYNGATVVISQAMSKKNGSHIMLETTDSAAKITEYYKKELDANGWKTEASMDMGAMSIITAHKDQRQLVIQVVGDNNKRSINQTLAGKD
ncbi:MAG: hypothetical protein M3Z23_11550 [Acidobacteriota bacterium]|nr:hypothetical protein [Acidobacteriota bacterium]